MYPKISNPSDQVMIDVDQASVTLDRVSLLDSVSFQTRAGNASVVCGANGAGKSTLLRLLAGNQKPSAGMVRIGGLPVDQRDRGFRRRVAAMIGLPPMAPDLTVLDHVALVATTWFGSAREIERVTRDVLAELDLTALAQRFPHELSSGQTQLFGLALILVRPADVFIFDEPEQRLDGDRQTMVVAALNARRATGATLVVATHSPTIVAGIAGETLFLRNEP